MTGSTASAPACPRGVAARWPLGRPSTLATQAMVATPHALATASGLHVLRTGGNAVDAVIAANAVLCVAYPHMAGLGGDLFALVAVRDGGVECLNASGPAARRATIGRYAASGHSERIPDRGPAAVLTVPGAVDGWWRLHQRHGRAPWDRLFQDAITAALGGVPVTRSLEAWVRRSSAVLHRYDSTSRSLRSLLAARGTGDVFRQERLATLLADIAARGARDGFYEGAFAERLGTWLDAVGSPLQGADLADYRAEWVAPLRLGFKDVDVLGAPPNSQGLTGLQMLGIILAFGEQVPGDDSFEYYHLQAEAAKLAAADRDRWLADPRHQPVPVEELLAPERLKSQAQRITASGVVDLALGRAPSGGDTCYLCAADSDGLAASLIQSVYHDFGSGLAEPDSGMLLQNRGSSFTLDPDHPNRLAPGKRPAHTLMPGMVMRHGRVAGLLGSMGGDGQPQFHAALLTRWLNFGYEPQAAIEAPRWLHGRTWGEPTPALTIEAAANKRAVERLEAIGHPVRRTGMWDQALGHAQMIVIDHDTGVFAGGADPRGDGSAMGL